MAIKTTSQTRPAQSQVDTFGAVRNDNYGAPPAPATNVGYLTELQLPGVQSSRQSCLLTPAPSDHQRGMLDKIRSGKFTERELIQLHANALERGGTHITAAVEEQMRARFPRAANRLFGKTAAFTTRCLQGVLAELSQKIDTSRNVLKNKVKAGGEMLSGRKAVNEYISFRTRGGTGTYLSLEQGTRDSELVAVVGRYRVGPGRFRQERVFTMGAFRDAVAEFLRGAQEAAGATT